MKTKGMSESRGVSPRTARRVHRRNYTTHWVKWSRYYGLLLRHELETKVVWVTFGKVA
jgi:hypothetical protein